MKDGTLNSWKQLWTDLLSRYLSSPMTTHLMRLLRRELMLRKRPIVHVPCRASKHVAFPQRALEGHGRLANSANKRWARLAYLFQAQGEEDYQNHERK